jgi:ABC-type cobalamin/Fe3+-siderophores transport system ATPase subunit
MDGVKSMDFKIKNFGKIAEANIKLDGITVICGNNNSGKSTVGKALFSFYNSLNDYKVRIYEEKNNYLRKIIIRYASDPMILPAHIIDPEYSMDFISEHDNGFTKEEIIDYLKLSYGVKLPKDQLDSLVEYLNAPENEILNEHVHRYITNVMNGQIKNAYSSNSSHCSISGEFKDFTNTIKIRKNGCSCELDEPIEHSAYYINTPFSLDSLNENRRFFLGIPPMSRNVIDAIQKAQADINENSMTNILDTVLNKKDLESVRKIIKNAYSGETIIDHGVYYYSENGVSIDFRNISAGLKSFALIERMLETGVLKKKDVLILDEPEIHLHSEWQIIYAELIVMLQKYFDLTILLVTHSFQFLESLDFFMKKHEILSKGNYYIPKQTDKGFKMESFGNDATELKKVLTTGSVTLSNLEFKYEMENYREREEDN